MSNLEMWREQGELRRADITEFVGKFWEDFGYGPSVRDIMKNCGFSSTSSVAHHLSILRDEGTITYQDRIARSVRLT